MTATTIKSENVTNLEAGTTLGSKVGKLRTIIDTDNLPTTSTDEANDIALFGPIPSNAVVVDALFLCDALDSGTPALAVNVGLYYSGRGGSQSVRDNGNLDSIKASGDTLDVDCMASAVTTFQAAKLTWTSLRFESTQGDITTCIQPIWQLAGLTSDPGGFFFLGLKVTTPGDTEVAGDVVARIDYIL